MALNFNSEPYFQAYQYGQDIDQQNKQRLTDSLNAIPQALIQYKQQQTAQERQALLDQMLKNENARKYGNPGSLPMENVQMQAQPGQNKLNLFGPSKSPLLQQFDSFMQSRQPVPMEKLTYDQMLSGYGTEGVDSYSKFLTAKKTPFISEADTDLKLARAEYLRRTPKENYNQENVLRTQFLGQSKDFSDTAASYQRMVDSSREPSAAGDLSLIFNYMKMLDPGSTVREGEFANAAASGSYGSRFQAAAQKIVSGQRLDDAMRQDFMNRATDLYEGQLSRHKQREGEFQGLAKSYGGDPNRVTPNIATPLGGYGAGSTQKIRVKNKATGQTGTISSQYFDPAKYERIE